MHRSGPNLWWGQEAAVPRPSRGMGGQGCFLSSCSEPQLQGQLQCLVPLDGRTELHPGGGRCVSFWFTDEKTEAQSTDLLPHLQGCWG